MKADVLVYASWSPLSEPQLIGVLSASHLKGRENFSFEFTAAWAKQKAKPKLGSDLPLATGKSFPRPGTTGFGIFSDAASDRLGASPDDAPGKNNGSARGAF